MHAAVRKIFCNRGEQKMETIKLPTFSCSVELLELQNSEELQSFCDLKLICCDGYIPIHKALLPAFTSVHKDVEEYGLPPGPHYSNFDELSSEIVLPNLTIANASKLVLLIYTGETLILKPEMQAIKPLFDAFRIRNLKRVTFQTAKIPNTRARSRSGSGDGKALSAGQNIGAPPISSTRESISRLKVRAIRFHSNEGDFNTVSGMGEYLYENVFICGDGSITEKDPSNLITRISDLYYDENGSLMTSHEDEGTGYLCEPCSLIFCHGSDYLTHSAQCSSKCPLMPPTATPKINIKMEEDEDIKVETTTTILATEEIGSGQRAMFSTINVCLVCVTTCKDPSELIVHCNEKHHISPEKDYDIGSWKCKRCQCTGSSNELSIFLQHVFHCRRQKQGNKRKRSMKENQDTNYVTAGEHNSGTGKRRKVCNPPYCNGVMMGTQDETDPSRESTGPVSTSDLFSESLGVDQLPPKPAEAEVNPQTVPEDVEETELFNLNVCKIVQAPVASVTPGPSTPKRDANTISRFKIPKLNRTLSLAFNQFPSRPPVSAMTPTNPLNTSEPLLRSPIALSQNQMFTFSTSEVMDIPMKAPERLVIDDKPRTSAPAKNYFQEKNSTVTFNGAKIAALARCTNFASVSSASSSAIKIVNCQSINKNDFNTMTPKMEDTSRGWLKKKKKKICMPIPSTPWNCLRCSGKFATQQIYMTHDCKRP